MKKLLAVLVVVLIILIAFAVGNTLSEEQSDPFSDMLNSTVNAAIDSSGIKDKIENSLYDNIDTISKKTGLPSSQVKKGIEDLDVSSWKATNLPSGVKPQGTDTINYNGTAAKITTYDDPSIVTVESKGVPITFEIPSSAQGSLDYLKYM